MSSIVCRWRNEGLAPRFRAFSQRATSDIVISSCPYIRLESLARIPLSQRTSETEAALILCELDRIADLYGPPSLKIAEAEALDSIEVTAVGGEDPGDGSCRLLLRGQFCGVGAKGFNIAVLDEQSGACERFQHFDTVEKDNDSERMADFLESIAYNRVVLVATQDSAVDRLGARAVTALRGIGADKLDKLEIKGAFALIGRKGAGPGSVPQEISERRKGPVTVRQLIPAPKVPLAVEVS